MQNHKKARWQKPVEAVRNTCGCGSTAQEAVFAFTHEAKDKQNSVCLASGGFFRENMLRDRSCFTVLEDISDSKC